MTTIRDHMTPIPHTIGQSQSIAEAARRMREHRIRHMPVLEGGQLVGLISDRDVGIVELVDKTRAEHVRVSEVMSPEAFRVEADADLATVVATMADRRVGSAIVMDRDRVIGIFTTTDALNLLARHIVLDELRNG